MENKESARPLIVIKDDKFVLVKETVDFIKTLKTDIGVVSVAGLYRTGKSYLLNRIRGAQGGFSVGPTINPCTKGIYIWGAPIQTEKLSILLIDTEGIGSIQQNQNYDSRIFSFAILLSSYFIYNSMSVLDERALESLSFIVNLTRHISQKNGSVSQFMPNFLWVLRDFALDLEDSNGAPITPSEYLETALTEVSGGGAKNDIRRAIKEFFVKRDCVTLVRPTINEKDLRTVDTLDESRLRPEFISEMERLRHMVIEQCEPKLLMGKTINGAGFVLLMEQYVDAINKGIVPDIRGTWESVAAVENTKALEIAKQMYKDDMAALLLEKKPIDHRVLVDNNEECVAKCKKLLHENCYGDSSKAIDGFEKFCNENFEHFLLENYSASSSSCEQLLAELFATIVQSDLQQKEYRSAHSLSNALAEVKKAYFDRAVGPAKFEVSSKFLTQKITESFIQYFDQVAQQHQVNMDEQKFIERRLNDQILLGQEEALRHKEESIQQLKQQQKLLLSEKELVRLTLEGRRQVELDLEKARQEIFSFQKKAEQQLLEEHNFFESIQAMIRDNATPTPDLEDGQANGHHNGKKHKNVRKVDTRFIATPSELVSHAASWKSVSDLIDRLLSENDILSAENSALNKYYNQITKERKQERTWADDSPHCLACKAVFSFWNPRHHCRACAKQYCDACCSHYVQFEELTELAAPSKARKCNSCMETYKHKISKI